MANKDDYLTEYRQFFEEFANTVEPNDQLPVKLGSYKFINSEVVGGIVDWCLQYLNRKSCPSTLVGPLTKITIDEIRMACRKHPVACGFNPNENVYEPLKLMQTVMSKVNEVCLRYLDNAQLDTLPTPPTVAPPPVSVCASRNTRRRMEDRHVVIHDINGMFNIPDTSPTSYYAIFDGHAGPDAASYSAAHLHQFLVESEFYPTDPERALKEAFLRTDEFFLEKSKIENFRSGTTAVCALLRPKEETLYVAWVGDSQALLVNRGKVLQIVKPHKPCREDEKDRIEANGGCVMFWGMWRVNGQLAVSRAIGDLKLKPYVTAEPDIVAVPLDGNEEFLIMACDGLWDFVSEDDAAIAVYKRIKENPENIDGIAESLSDLAKQEGSRDNISIIVIFLKDPSKIAKKLSADWGWTGQTPVTMETGVDNTNINNTASNNAFDLFDVFQKRGNLDHFNEPEIKSNGTDAKTSELYLFDRPANGKRPADEFDEEDDDFGPETDVDAVDDVLLSPSIASAKALAEGNGNNNDNEDKVKMDALDVDLELQRQQSSEFEPMREAREETPTPPADSVLDSSGLADNVAESGEDSEDEWNYYRVDPKQKESTVPSLETNNKVSAGSPQLDDMSQLNPDAKEFVPVSPTRTAVSPAPYSRDLMDDALIAQSPRRAVPMDISVPSPNEFQLEAKQRPSELFDDEFEGEKTQNQNGHQLSSQEIMQNLLNGKDVSEIEFHPSNYVKPVNDNYFENNLIENQNQETETSKENITPSEEHPTESSLSPMRDESDFATFVPKPQDPMSMSFYQDKDEEVGFSTNPFDLNKVQLLPDNVDEFIQRSTEVESPLAVPLSPTVDAVSPVQSEQELEQVKSQEESVLSKSPAPEEPKAPKSPLPEEKSPVPEIPNTPEICELTKSPIPEVDISKSPFEIEENKSLLEIANSQSPICEAAKSPISEASPSPVCEVAKSSSSQASPSPVCEISPSPVSAVSPTPVCEASPSPVCAVSPTPVCEISPSPVCEISPSPVCEVSPSPVCEVTPSPVCEISPSPVCAVSASPVCEISPSPVCEVSQSPVCEISLPEVSQPVCEIAKSPLLEISKSPILDVHSPMELSSPVGPLSPKSPIPELTGLVSPDITASIKDENISGEISETAKSPVLDDILENELAKSPVLEKVESPVEVTEQIQEASQNVEQTLSELVEQTADLINQVSDDIQMKIGDEESNLQELISDAIQDVTTEHKEPEAVEAKSPVLDVCELKKEVEEQIVDIVQEATAVTSEAQEVVKDVIENVTNEMNNLIDVSTVTVASENAPSEIINSFLERSTVPEVTSPLSPSENPREEMEKFQTEPPESWKQNLEIKCETIKPEFAVHTMASPSEESKGTDTPPPTPAVVIEEPELKRGSPEPQKIVEAVENLKTTKEKPAKPTTTKTTGKPSAITKKPLASKPSPTSPSKPLPGKTTTTAKKPTTTLTPKPSTPRLSKSSTTPTASPRTATTPRTTPKPPTPKPAEKKPLTNGDVKPAARTTLLKKTTTTTATKTTAAPKLSPTKPATSRPSSVATSKPAPRPAATTMAPKPRPSSLTAKTSTASAATTKTATSRPTSSTRPATTTTTTARPKPATSTTSTLASRARLTAAAKPASKTPDTEKQIKETANKQLSAARTTSNRTTAATAAKTATAARKIDSKTSLTSRTTTTRTTTTTLKSATKKPTEVTRTTVTKTKTAVAKPSAEQNGVVNVIQEITTTIVSDDPQLLKDNSPVDNADIDNSKLPVEVIAD